MAVARGAVANDNAGGTFPNCELHFLPFTCQHCDTPACFASCPVGAIVKEDNGIVSTISELCIGCDACIEACPYEGVRTLISGEPPTPTRKAAAPIMVTMGPHTPAPARASSPTPGMLPMYIRSTTLYKTLTNWASILGRAIRSTSRRMGSRPRSFSTLTRNTALQGAYRASYL